MKRLLGYSTCGHKVLDTTNRLTKQEKIQFSHSVMSSSLQSQSSTPGFPVHHQLPELAKTHVHQVGDAIQACQPRRPLLLLPSSGSFPIRQFFASGGESIGATASASVLPINIQDLFPLGLTGLIS